jgi:EAL domain-containing protein (putative c-di-GMP-specific phosphodiesterase class I)
VFIPVAEENGLIYSIGQWVLREACKQLCEWQKTFPLRTPLSMNVNISSKQLEHPELADCILEILRETGLEPSCLHLELTENIFLKESDSIVALLERLHQIGVMIFIDDFGTGYSSFSYLQRYPINVIKIDQAFVKNIGMNGDNSEIVKTILMLARELRMDTVAEGVETQTQVDRLRTMECPYGQGFFFYRPLPLDMASQLVKMQYELNEGILVPVLGEAKESINAP